jgi:hypothetical protein
MYLRFFACARGRAAVKQCGLQEAKDVNREFSFLLKYADSVSDAWW